MTDPQDVRAFIFKNRGALLSLPALVLARFGKPGAFGIALGLPLAFAGEALRCWAVGYSGETTRNDRVEAPQLVTAGPYAHVRNPLYLGNFITACGFALAFTGGNRRNARAWLAGAALGTMGAVYAAIIPFEERYLAGRFGRPYEEYCAAVPRIIPKLESDGDGQGTWKSGTIAAAESKTFMTFAAMLVVLAIKARSA